MTLALPLKSRDPGLETVDRIFVLTELCNASGPLAHGTAIVAASEKQLISKLMVQAPRVTAFKLWEDAHVGDVLARGTQIFIGQVRSIDDYRASLTTAKRNAFDAVLHSTGHDASEYIVTSARDTSVACIHRFSATKVFTELGDLVFDQIEMRTEPARRREIRNGSRAAKQSQPN